MDYCTCGGPLDFSPDGVHCLSCSEAGSFVQVDSVSSMVTDMRAAGFSAWSTGGGFATNMTDEEYSTFMTARGYVRDDT
ncbi:hypothetical protein [Dictyobacter arantiisoli]|uniref:Uncharacterized protein n=1 Tax=Dictyobacter arantiisoli TaxID=2014874 RepID=A0A5A5T7F1_9CHLR|nr:hypothetical protein [Dictyobacter arantiisoli]GCF07342.1 hypothetical protein KDI_09060 [Dictyobacter arantiisoli]